MDATAAKFIGAGLAAIGMIGSGIGVGNVWANLITAVGRNPAFLLPALIGAVFYEEQMVLALRSTLLPPSPGKLFGISGISRVRRWLQR